MQVKRLPPWAQTDKSTIWAQTDKSTIWHHLFKQIRAPFGENRERITAETVSRTMQQLNFSSSVLQFSYKIPMNESLDILVRKLVAKDAIFMQKVLLML